MAEIYEKRFVSVECHFNPMESDSFNQWVLAGNSMKETLFNRSFWNNKRINAAK